MSIIEILSKIRELAGVKRKQKEPLPWFCIILSDKCINSEKICMECIVYQEHKGGITLNDRNAKNSVTDKAIRDISLRKLDYSKFKTYKELQKYVIENNSKIHTKAQADKFIRENMPKESYFQKKILDWIKNNIPDAVAWKEAAGAYSRQGIPDITCIVDGKYYGFEVKRPFIGVLSKIQEQTIKALRKAGAVAEVVSSEKEVEAIIKRNICIVQVVKDERGLID